MEILKWQKQLLELINKSKDKKIALGVDVSTDEYPIETIRQIIELFEQVKEGTPLVLADFKLREVTDTKQAKNITFHTHGRASYTEALEWGQENEIDIFFYITDVTGYFWDELKIDYEVIWLIPDKFKPQVPFGKTLNLV
ncbi:VWA-like domain-containing protein [Oceanobacillus sp. Castelsardo]|uniref:VWA-like domain-containing protein n=1 Tax=Oceanobacillus sp. Castelsardo TaxID=1851204 RepID=UPI001E542F19|nr:VWA-like domain-containing protein [Oceanobacillus sp. Castelsardo]